MPPATQRQCSIDNSPVIKPGSDLLSEPPPTHTQFEPLDVLCVHVFLSHTCHSGTDFVLTLLVHDVIL